MSTATISTAALSNKLRAARRNNLDQTVIESIFADEVLIPFNYRGFLSRRPTFLRRLFSILSEQFVCENRIRLFKGRLTRQQEEIAWLLQGILHRFHVLRSCFQRA
jgi:hypothetical protein